MVQRIARALPGLLAPCLVACLAASPAPNPGTPVLMSPAQGDPVLLAGGSIDTLERPEIGRLEMYTGGGSVMCSATVVRPDATDSAGSSVLLTAAHCVGYTSRGADPRDKFIVQTPTNSAGIYYPVLRYHSFGTEVGPRDLAVVQLAVPVDYRVARAAPLARQVPEEHSGVNVYGYGCKDRQKSNDSGIKRRWAFEWDSDDLRRLCYGDSGGPVVLGNGGAVFAVNSGHEGRHGSPGEDIYALVPPMRDELQDQINAWVSPPADRLPSPTLFLGAAFGGSGGYGDYAHSGTTGLIEVGGKGHLAGTRAFAQIALLFVPGTYTVSYDFPLAGGGAGESKLNPGLGGGMSGLLGLSFGHLDVGVGPEGTFSEFDTDANTLVTIPRECVWTDGVCVEQAQPGATNSGASGLYQPALGYARETKGVVFRLGATLDLRYRFDISSSNAICAVFKLSWMNSRVTGENSTDGFWWQSVDALGGLAFELGD